MADALKDILSNFNSETNQEQLLQYLNNRLSNEQQHSLEKDMLKEDFDTDALEGLEQIENPRQLELLVERLNRDLRKRTAKKLTAREKRTLKPQWGLYFSIIILLIILVMVYLYLHRTING